MIEPTVARQLWYWPTPDECAYNGNTQPFCAVVTHVFSNTCVNIIALNEVGEAIRKTSVTLAQDTPAETGQCEWTPFQKRQAALQEIVTGAIGVCQSL